MSKKSIWWVGVGAVLSASIATGTYAQEVPKAKGISTDQAAVQPKGLSLGVQKGTVTKPVKPTQPVSTDIKRLAISNAIVNSQVQNAPPKALSTQIKSSGNAPDTKLTADQIANQAIGDVPKQSPGTVPKKQVVVVPKLNLQVSKAVQKSEPAPSAQPVVPVPQPVAPVTVKPVTETKPSLVSKVLSIFKPSDSQNTPKTPVTAVSLPSTKGLAVAPVQDPAPVETQPEMAIKSANQFNSQNPIKSQFDEQNAAKAAGEITIGSKANSASRRAAIEDEANAKMQDITNEIYKQDMASNQSTPKVDTQKVQPKVESSAPPKVEAAPEEKPGFLAKVTSLFKSDPAPPEMAVKSVNQFNSQNPIKSQFDEQNAAKAAGEITIGSKANSASRRAAIEDEANGNMQNIADQIYNQEMSENQNLSISDRRKASDNLANNVARAESDQPVNNPGLLAKVAAVFKSDPKPDGVQLADVKNPAGDPNLVQGKPNLPPPDGAIAKEAPAKPELPDPAATGKVGIVASTVTAIQNASKEVVGVIQSIINKEPQKPVALQSPNFEMKGQFLPYMNSSGRWVRFPMEWTGSGDVGPIQARIEIVELDPKLQAKIIGQVVPGELPKDLRLVRGFGTIARSIAVSPIGDPSTTDKYSEIQAFDKEHIPSLVVTKDNPNNVLAYRYIFDVPVIRDKKVISFGLPNNPEERRAEYQRQLLELPKHPEIAVTMYQYATPFAPCLPSDIKLDTMAVPAKLDIQGAELLLNPELALQKINQFELGKIAPPPPPQNVIDQMVGAIKGAFDGLVEFVSKIFNPESPAPDMSFDRLPPIFDDNGGGAMIPMEWRIPVSGVQLSIQIEVIELNKDDIPKVIGQVISDEATNLPFKVTQTQQLDAPFERISPENWTPRMPGYEVHRLQGSPPFTVKGAAPGLVSALRYVVTVTDLSGSNIEMLNIPGTPVEIEKALSDKFDVYQKSGTGLRITQFRLASPYKLVMDPRSFRADEVPAAVVQYDGENARIEGLPFKFIGKKVSGGMPPAPESIAQSIAQAISNAIAAGLGLTKPAQIQSKALPSSEMNYAAGNWPPLQVNGNCIAFPLNWALPVPASTIHFELQVVEFESANQPIVLQNSYPPELSKSNDVISLVGDYHSFTQFKSLERPNPDQRSWIEHHTMVRDQNRMPAVVLKASSPTRQLAYRYVVSIPWVGPTDQWSTDDGRRVDPGQNPGSTEARIAGMTGQLLANGQIQGDLHVFTTPFRLVPENNELGRPANPNQEGVVFPAPEHLTIPNLQSMGLPINFVGIRRAAPQDFKIGPH